MYAARDADCVVAHNTAAKPVIEALAKTSSALPVLLLSPLLFRRNTALLKVLRVVIETRLGGRVLTALARSKKTRLLNDRQFLKEQLLMFVDEAKISAALFEEAISRARDPRTAR